MSMQRFIVRREIASSQGMLERRARGGGEEEAIADSGWGLRDSMVVSLGAIKAEGYDCWTGCLIDSGMELRMMLLLCWTTKNLGRTHGLLR